MEKKKIRQLGEMSQKSIGFYMFLTLKDAVNWIKRNHFDCDIVEFTYEGHPYKLEMRFTLVSQKKLF